MQIVEYLYGTVHGNDLRSGIEPLWPSTSSLLLLALEREVKPNQIGYILSPCSPRAHIAPLENFVKVETHDCNREILREWSLESIYASMDVKALIPFGAFAFGIRCYMLVTCSFN